MPETDLHKAARDGNTDECDELIQQGLNVNEKGAQGRTALHRALGGGFHECAEFLIEKGADVNMVDGLKRTSLHWAAMGQGTAEQQVSCCNVVFSKGEGNAMLVKITKSGSTPLHSAAGTNKPDIVKFLVEKGADQLAKDEDEMTAYDLAKAQGYSEVLAHLDAPAKAGGEGGGGCCLVQ